MYNRVNVNNYSIAHSEDKTVLFVKIESYQRCAMTSYLLRNVDTIKVGIWCLVF